MQSELIVAVLLSVGGQSPVDAIIHQLGHLPIAQVEPPGPLCDVSPDICAMFTRVLALIRGGLVFGGAIVGGSGAALYFGSTIEKWVKRGLQMMKGGVSLIVIGLLLYPLIDLIVWIGGG